MLLIQSFLKVVPEGEEKGLLDASLFMDDNECKTVIPATRGAVGLSYAEVMKRLETAQVRH